jgi:DNA-binding transcriptional LysR family regulator
MDLKRLKTFIRVAQTLNLSEAARQIHRTQSSVTGQMQALEADLGLALFDRSNRKLALTAAGECLLGYAAQLIDLADQARGAVLAAGGVACQTLDVGGIETIAAACLPDVVARMAPRIRTSTSGWRSPRRRNCTPGSGTARSTRRCSLARAHRTATSIAGSSRTSRSS